MGQRMIEVGFVTSATLGVLGVVIGTIMRIVL